MHVTKYARLTVSQFETRHEQLYERGVVTEAEWAEMDDVVVEEKNEMEKKPRDVLVRVRER